MSITITETGAHPLIVAESQQQGLVSFDGKVTILHRCNLRVGGRADDVRGYGAYQFERLVGLAPKAALRAGYEAQRRRRKAHLAACKSHMADGRCFRCGEAL